MSALAVDARDKIGRLSEPPYIARLTAVVYKHRDLRTTCKPSANFNPQASMHWQEARADARSEGGIAM